MEHKYLRWFSSSTASIYWHDSTIFTEQQEAFSNGAVGMTTNPFLVQTTLNQDRPFWEERLAKLPKGLKGDEKCEALIGLVTGFYAEQCRPIFEKGIPGEGYVCAQTNPTKTGDAEYMIAQMKRYAQIAPNIVIKVPATNAGITAFEEGTALGFNMAATISFTVPQALAVGEAAARGIERAKKAGIKPGLTAAVMMAGRLDDYLRDVAHDTGACVSESDIVQAGIACVKKVYGIFQERKYETFLLPAGLRGANQIVELAGGHMIFSLAPKIVKLLPSEAVCEERMHIPVDQDVIDRLMTMPEFRKAYLEDGMTRNEFITFGSSNRTTDQFINDGWNPLLAYEY